MGGEAARQPEGGEREKRDRGRLLRNSEGGKRARECDREERVPKSHKREP